MSERGDKLTEALVLAIVAPSEEQAQRAASLAEQITVGLSKFEVAQAKQRATALADEWEG